MPCVCGNQGGITTRRRDRYGLHFAYKLCLMCGHVRTSNPLSEDAATTFYQSSDYRSMYLPGEEPQDVLRRKTPKPGTVSPILGFVRQFRSSPGTILEWGCSGGWNLVPFRDAGWSVVGFDVDRRYVGLGREMLGLDLREIASSESDPDSVPRADVILLNHVLEHAINPTALLAKLRGFSGPDTLIVVGVPLLETIRYWRWASFFHVAHIHYFSARTLGYVANLAQLRVVHQDVERGMFVLQRVDDGALAASSPGRRSGMLSAGYLIVGFVDVGYRLRQLVRGVLKGLGLLSVVRRVRAQRAR